MIPYLGWGTQYLSDVKWEQATCQIHSSYLTAEKDNDASGSASASDGATHVLVLSHDVDVYTRKSRKPGDVGYDPLRDSSIRV